MTTAPNTKQQLLALIDTYIPTTPSPNIRAAEHRDLETKILDRVDGRILATGNLQVPAWDGYKTITIGIPQTYTTNYIVFVTPYYFTGNGNATIPKINSYKTTYSIANRTKFGFTLELYSNANLNHGVSGNYAAKFTYVVISKDPL